MSARRVAILAVIGLLAAAGCGSGSKASFAAKTTSTVHPTTTASAAQGTIRTIPQTTTTVASGAARSKPVPLGQPGMLTTPPWTLTVGTVTPDANASIAAKNSFNRPPAAGLQFFMVEVTFVYRGGDPSSPIELSMEAVGASNVIYTTFQNTCGVVPDNARDLNKVFSGGTVTGNVCWEIRSDDADSLVMTAGKSFGNAAPVFMALH